MHSTKNVELASENKIELKPELKNDYKPEIKPDFKSEMKTELKQEYKLEKNRSMEEQNILAMDNYQDPENVYLDGNVEGYRMDESNLSFSL